MLDMLKRDLNLRLVGVRGDYMICKIHLNLIFYDCIMSCPGGELGNLTHELVWHRSTVRTPGSCLCTKKKQISILKASTNSDTVSVFLRYKQYLWRRPFSWALKVLPHILFGSKVYEVTYLWLIKPKGYFTIITNYLK